MERRLTTLVLPSEATCTQEGESTVYDSAGSVDAYRSSDGRRGCGDERIDEGSELGGELHVWWLVDGKWFSGEGRSFRPSSYTCLSSHL